MLHVRDASHPHFAQQKDVVTQTLRDAGVPEEKLDMNVIEVWTKIDLLNAAQVTDLLPTLPPFAVPVSSRDETGLPLLLELIDNVASRAAAGRVELLAKRNHMASTVRRRPSGVDRPESTVWRPV